MCVSFCFLFISDWGGEGSRRPGAPAYRGERAACCSVTPDGSSLKHFTSLCLGPSTLEWSPLRSTVWLWAAHFPCLSPLFPSPFYAEKTRFNNKLDLNPKTTAQDKAAERLFHVPRIFLPPAPPPRHHHCPSRPRTAPEQPSPPSSSPTRASSRKSRGWPAAQRPAAHSPPWASSPPSLPASQPPSCCTPSGSPDLGRPPPCRVQRKKPEKPMGGSAATPTAPATTSRGARHLMGSPDGIR